MTGLDTEILREALRAGHDPGGALDVALIMDRGRRLRRRRRAAAVAGTLCALALLAGAGTGLADLASSPAPVAPASPVRPAPHGTRVPIATATAKPATPVPIATATPTPTASPAAPGGSESVPAPTPTANAPVTGQTVPPRVTGQPTAASQPPCFPAVVIALTRTPGPCGKHGVITHHTTTVEHPRLVAQRLERFARILGRENVIGGADCGFAQTSHIRRTHPEVVWAKFSSLVEGARIASDRVWGS